MKANDKPCKYCGGDVDRSHPRANNKKFCSLTCRNKQIWQDNKEQRIAEQRAKAGRKEKGKIQCLICGLYYHRPITHARQIHGVSESEYKEEYGYNRIGGITSEISAEKSREAVFENFDKCIVENLVEKGEKTRFQKGDKTLGTYPRREKALIYKKNRTR